MANFINASISLIALIFFSFLVQLPWLYLQPPQSFLEQAV